ncbi:cardiolipin synthase [Clostridioides difficile Y155]|nr:cardiolipin synthase [Clostridioides difficile]EQI25776.1 cardiolipin synthase [Clostridioides difficile Y155]
MGVIGTIFLFYLIISYLAGAIISVIILLENRDPAKTMSWLLMFIIFPGVGLMIYAISGRNIRKRKLFKTQKLANNIKEKKLFDTLEKITEIVELEKESIKQNKLLRDEEDGSYRKRVINMLLKTGMFPFTKNNKVDVFVDGNEKFKRLIEDIREAKDHIHLEYFIIKDSEIGRVLKEELIKKAKEGIKIRILYDDVGCWRFWFNRKFFREMREVGIEIAAFLPTKFPIIGGKLNYRNHRKIVVIDGIIGYTGGINIGDEYLGKNDKFGYWRDTHIRIKGISVYMLQMTFLIDWYYTTKEVLVTKNYFPSVGNVGESMIQVVASGPDSDWKIFIMLIFLQYVRLEKMFI